MTNLRTEFIQANCDVRTVPNVGKRFQLETARKYGGLCELRLRAVPFSQLSPSRKRKINNKQNGEKNKWASRENWEWEARAPLIPSFPEAPVYFSRWLFVHAKIEKIKVSIVSYYQVHYFNVEQKTIRGTLTEHLGFGHNREKTAQKQDIPMEGGNFRQGITG